MPGRTRIITVSGSHSGAGKTTLAESLVALFDECIAVKAKVGQENELDVLIEDAETATEGKDTGRLMAAGARRAYLLRGTVADLKRKVERLAQTEDVQAIVIECDTLAEDLETDLSFFVEGSGAAKPGSRARAAGADVLVNNVARGEPPMHEQKSVDVLSEVKRTSTDGKLPCKQALALANRLDISPRRVGEAANEAGIKIVSCQLGCFG
jgi:hypothetical protein